MRAFLSAMNSGIYAVLTSEAMAVGLGGALGANARYWLGKWIKSLTTHHALGHFPIATVAINISGSLLLGVLVAFFSMGKLPAPAKFWLLLIGAGFCGGYTTFSTFSIETFDLIEQGKWHLAVINVAASVIIGIVAVGLAFYLIRKSWPQD